MRKRLFNKNYVMNSKSIIILLLILLGGSADIFGQALYFIHSGPTRITGTPQVPYETRIYQFNEDDRVLEQVWTLGKNREAQKIGVYSTPGSVVISDYRELNILSMNFDDKPAKIKLNNVITNFHYYEFQKNKDIIEIGTMKKNKDNKPVFNYEYFSIDGAKEIPPEKGSNFAGSIRVCGPRPIGCNEHDIIHFRKLGEGKLKAVDTEIEFEMAPIPDSIIQLESPKGRNLLANTPEFYALSSLPHRNDLTQIEILIYSRLTKSWNSMLIEGAETAPRLINGWLVGEVKDMNPESDYEIAHKIFPSILKGTCVIINPLESSQFIVDLGIGSSILWIEDDIVYYKTVSPSEGNLYKARIENGNFSDVELLASNPVIKYFRWAFRGQSPEQIKHKNIE